MPDDPEIRIDLNLRYPGGTFVGFEDLGPGVLEQLKPGRRVLVCAQEAEWITGEAVVDRIAQEAELVYLLLDFRTLRGSDG